MSKNKKDLLFWVIELIISSIAMLCLAGTGNGTGAIISYMFIFMGLIMLGRIWIKKQKEEDNVPLTNDMEIFIAGLELRPKKNKEIKNIALYLEKSIMPNEEILAVPSLAGIAYAILTDKRVILKDSAKELITPIEKINNVIRNYRTIHINDNFITLSFVGDAEKFVYMLNNKISNIQTIQETIKVENKIITEESITSQLQKLSNLHDSKVLSDYEYYMKKQELLNKMK